MQTHFRAAVLSALCLTLCVLGCGGSDLAKVRGKVTVDGNPMPCGRIQFSPVPAEGSINANVKPAHGYLQPDGSFELTTFKKNDGAAIGKHRVTIVNEMEEGNTAKMPKSIPEFALLNLVGKRYEVVAGENDISIELTSEIIREFGED